MTNTQQWPINLVKNEYFKDNGIRGERLQQLISFIPLGRTEEGNYLYEVTKSGSCPNTEQWELERYDLSFISRKHLISDSKTVNHLNTLIPFISKATGYHLLPGDIGGVTFHKTYWIIDVAKDSLRFTGSFSIMKK